MNNIYFESQESLFRQLSEIDIKVPKRSKGRKTKHTETNTICKFLSTNYKREFFQYPFEIIHRDKPDFQIKMQKTKIGIEITESIPEQYSYIFALAEKYYPKASIEPTMFLRNAPKRNKEELLEILRKSQYQLNGIPIAGDKIESDWAEWIHEDITTKTIKLNSNEFDKLNINFLVIYDNLPRAANNVERQNHYLRPLIKEYWDSKNYTFDRIFILSESVCIEVSKNCFKVDVTNNIWV
jgi:hypothetical protein